MRTALHVLLTENPFALLGLTVDASARDVRRRVEDFELGISLGDGSGMDHVVLARAGQVLADPEQRFEFELFSPWGGTVVYGTHASEHDNALAQTTIFLNRKQHGTPAMGVESLRSWIKCADHPVTAAMVDQRYIALTGSAGTKPFASMVSEAILPAIVRQTVRIAYDIDDHSQTVDKSLSYITDPWYDVVALLARTLNSVVIVPNQSAYNVIAEQTLHILADASLFDIRQMVDLVPAITGIDIIVRYLPDQDAGIEILHKLVDSVIDHLRPTIGISDWHTAEVVLTTLYQCRLSLDDREVVRELLTGVQFRAACARGEYYADRGQWADAEAEYRQALVLAPDQVNRRNITGWIEYVGKRRRRRGAGANENHPEYRRDRIATARPESTEDHPRSSTQRNPGVKWLRLTRRWLWAPIVLAGAMIAYQTIFQEEARPDSPIAVSYAASPASFTQSENPGSILATSVALDCVTQPASGSPLVLHLPQGSVREVRERSNIGTELWYRDAFARCWIKYGSSDTQIFTTEHAARSYAASFAPQPVSGPTFVVNTSPVGCHYIPTVASGVAVNYPIGSVQAMDQFRRESDGLWHREVEKQCWTRTDPGPVRTINTLSDAERYATSLRRQAFGNVVRPILNDVSDAQSVANSIPVQTYSQATGNAAFAAAADRVVRTSRQLRSTVTTAPFNTEFIQCRDALVTLAQAEERVWSDFSAAARSTGAGSVASWNRAVDSQDALRASQSGIFIPCLGV